MLSELHVRNLALIEETWLEFGPGMTALTGETGAGKTVLVGALKLLLGERADSSDVRHGAAEAVVEGRLTFSAGEVIARRRVSADGRSRCTLDGDMVTVGQLAERLGPLVDLHGQHEHQALLSAATHVEYLDRWAGPAVARARAEYETALGDHGAAAAECARLQGVLSDSASRADYLRFVVAEIDSVAPLPNEDDELRAQLPALQHAEKLSSAANDAVVALRDDGGASDALASALGALGRVEGIDPALDALIARLRDAEAVLDDTSAEVRSYRDRVEHDPAALDRVLARLAELSSLAKKHGPTLGEVLRTREEAAATIEALDLGEEGLVAARRAVETAAEKLLSAGRELAKAREAAAPEFAAALEAAAGELALEGATVAVDFTDLDFDRWTEAGPHRVEFLYSPAAGVPPRPLARIASGGEVSRVMLALKGVLGGADDVEILVFDEVDAGIGGATAHAVGRRLAELAREHQVIVVTHLAQVAAYADRQLVVEKNTAQGGAATRVYPVEGEERVAEISRMLSGDDTAVSLEHARELLARAEAAV